MSTSVPDWASLRLLMAIAHRGSIAAAARATGVSQQSASERLRAIETQMGLTLVQRGARGSVLTPAGTVVTEWVAQLVGLADEVDTAIQGLRGARGRELQVWASMTIAESLIPRWLVQLRERQRRSGDEHTAVSLTAANSHDVRAAVLSGEALLGFVEGVEAPSGVQWVAVAEDELVLVTAAGSAIGRRRRPLSPEQVAQLPLTSREPGSGTREVVERALELHGLRMHASTVELTTGTAIREAVLAGSSPAFLSRRVAARDLESGHLVAVPTADLELRRVFRAIWVGSKEPPRGPVRDLVSIARRPA